jgi:hypothetical protein
VKKLDCPQPDKSWNRGSARRRAALGGLTALALWVFVSPAAAFHIPGATYNGTHAAGGTVSFTLTADGSGLTNFAVGGPVQGNVCTFGGSTINFVQPLPIVNHAFNSSSGTTTLSGSFPGVQQASGSFRIKTFPPFSCDSGTVSWTARTTASPAASEECKSARAAVDDASMKLEMAERKLRKAKKAVKKAKTPSAKNKARSRLRKARAAVRAAKKAKKQAEQAAGPVCG